MATIRAYTTIEQSRKLAEILPLKSADMCYRAYREEGGIPDYFATLCPYLLASWVGIPCWSLIALLGVLPEGYSFTLTKSFDGKDYYCKLDGEPIETMADNPIDACYEMIIRLHELNELKGKI